MLEFYIIVGALALASWLVSKTLKNKFKKYAEIHLRNGLSGAEIAEKMLADHGIRDVSVTSTPGMLTDHYDPRTKSVNLSADVYEQRNATAAAIAAHEVGHAVQHAQAYEWLTLRSQLVPIVSASSRFSQWLVIGGLILGAASNGPGIGYYIALVGLCLMAVATVFSFVTLPVEYDASNRALAWLKNKQMVTREEYSSSKDALKWAARTYLVAAFGSLAMLLYWGVQVLGGRD